MHKKILAVSAAAALLTASGAAFAQQNVFATADLNVRAGPGTNHRVVGTIGANDPATILNCAGNWCRVSYGGGEGWASARYLADAGGYAYDRSSDRRGSGAGVAAGATSGVIAGALIGGPVGAAVGGIAGGAIGAGAEAAGDGARRGASTAAGVTTGAIGGAIIGGPVGAVIGGVAGGAIGAGTGAAFDDPYVDRTMTSSIVPDRVPLSAITNQADEHKAELSYVEYNGRTLMVETATGKVVRVLR